MVSKTMLTTTFDFYSQKELVIKIDRSENAQLVLNKLSSLDNPPNVPNNSFTSRKTSATKNYCEVSSGGEDDEDDDSGRQQNKKRRSEC